MVVTNEGLIDRESCTMNVDIVSSDLGKPPPRRRTSTPSLRLCLCREEARKMDSDRGRPRRLEAQLAEARLARRERLPRGARRRHRATHRPAQHRLCTRLPAAEELLITRMARAEVVQPDRAATMTIIIDIRACVIDRAADLSLWDDDREDSIARLAARLAKDPRRVSLALYRTKQGTALLLEHWEGLGDALRTNGGWDEAQRALAFDLLGVPAVLRSGSTLVPDAADAAGLAALVEPRPSPLAERYEGVLSSLDEARRAAAAVGMGLEEDAESARLRRYEASACSGSGTRTLPNCSGQRWRRRSSCKASRSRSGVVSSFARGAAAANLGHSFGNPGRARAEGLSAGGRGVSAASRPLRSRWPSRPRPRPWLRAGAPAAVATFEPAPAVAEAPIADATPEPAAPPANVPGAVYPGRRRPRRRPPRGTVASVVPRRSGPARPPIGRA